MDASGAIELLKQIISIPSFSKQEDKVADLITDVLKRYRFDVHRKGNNVWSRSKNFDDAKPTLLLDAHLDTVRPNGIWDSDPFTPVVKEGKLFGLGSNDTGGSLVSMLAVFVELASGSLPCNLIFLASAEEENTGSGGIQSVFPELGRVDFALVGEPTGMCPAIAEKGLMVLDCYARGKAGHAAREEGVNAIYEAMEDIHWFRTYRFEKISELLGPVKMSVTGIEAGTLHNMVPATCHFMVDIRVNELYTNQEIFDTIRDHVKCDMIPRSFSLNSSSVSPSHPMVKRCIELGLSPYGSPTTSNQAVIPCPSLKIGPGNSARSHTANEYIRLEEIREGIKWFKSIIQYVEL